MSLAANTAVGVAFAERRCDRAAAPNSSLKAPLKTDMWRLRAIPSARYGVTLVVRRDAAEVENAEVVPEKRVWRWRFRSGR